MTGAALLLAGSGGQSALFDGTVYLSRGDFSGVNLSSNQAGIIDILFESKDNSQSSAFIDTYGGLGFRLEFTSKKLILVRGADCQAIITPEIEDDSNFHHALISWGIGATQVKVFADNAVAGLDSNAGTNPTIQDTGVVRVGRYGGGGSNISACIHRLWYLPIANGTFIDVHSSSIYRKFIKADGTPEDLGANGEIPFGQQPAIYMKGNSASFDTNLGYGGAFTATGTLKNCSGVVRL